MAWFIVWRLAVPVNKGHTVSFGSGKSYCIEHLHFLIYFNSWMLLMGLYFLSDFVVWFQRLSVRFSILFLWLIFPVQQCVVLELPLGSAMHIYDQVTGSWGSGCQWLIGMFQYMFLFLWYVWLMFCRQTVFSPFAHMKNVLGAAELHKTSIIQQKVAPNLWEPSRRKAKCVLDDTAVCS